MAHTSGGQQVRSDQTETVKGQNGKTMVTAGTIKRLLPCPVKGGQKTEHILESKRKKKKKKTEQEEKKRIRKKTEKKRKKN